jgi:2-methylisocitrate lyase-like PEP mutase family enzyme
MEPDKQTSNLDKTAQQLKACHLRHGDPLVLANVYDIPSLNALLSVNEISTPRVKAIASASAAFAETFGIPDEDLSFEQNFAAIAPIATRARSAGLPLTADLQDGYGDRIVECIQTAIQLGAVGANIEDSFPHKGFSQGVEGSLRNIDDATGRIKLALSTATDMGVPNFVINARTDVMRLSPAPDDALEETIRRGKSYLEAGATTVFVWGGSKRGLRTEEVERLIDEFNGQLAVKLSDEPDGLTVDELAKMGVARISVGPSLYLAAMDAFKSTARRILEGGRLHV